MKNDKFNINDSIILDPERTKSNNIKKILTAIAILVVLFLIVLIIMKFINSGNEATNEPLVMPSEELIFKPKVAETEVPQKPIVIEEKPKTQPIIETKPPQTIKIEPKPIEITPIERVTEPPKQEPNPQPTTVVSKQPDKVKQPDKPIEPKIVQAKKEVVVVTAKEPKPKEKTVAKKEEVKVAPKPQNKPAQTKPAQGDLAKGNYIQVLATSEFKPDADYIKKLTSKGYNYKLHKTVVNGKEFTKVLVGPFSNAAIDKEIANVRASINKNAFIYRIK